MKIYNISENKKQNFNKGNQIFISLFLQITSLKVSAFWGTSGQYGDISRYTLPPHTTKRRTTTNLKTKNNQNCQKIELYGSLTTKELKKKHSSRLVRGWRWTAGVRRTAGKARQRLEEWEVPHLHVDKQGGATGERDRLSNPGTTCGEIRPQNL